MRIITPFAPFEPESPAHKKLGPFDWIDAIRMHRESVRRSCDTETVILTDQDAELPGPLLRYPKRQQRLMLWILEVALRYIESDDFDQDTVMMSPDTLCFADMRVHFGGDFDIGLLVRPGERFAKKPLLNAVQLWPVKSKAKLVAFYEQALRLAELLPEEQKKWGADTTPIVRLISPVELGCRRRFGTMVRMIDAHSLLVSPSPWLRKPELRTPPEGVVVDFKYRSKHNMRQFYEQVMK